MTLAIMYKESFDALNLSALGTTALVIFVATFVATAIWVALQAREEVQRWSDLPLADDAGTPRGDSQQSFVSAKEPLR